jgi:hypothetical protein
MITYNETQFNTLVGNYANAIFAYIDEYGTNIDDTSIIDMLFSRENIDDYAVAVTGTGAHKYLKQYFGTRNYEDKTEYFTKKYEPKEFNLAAQFGRKFLDDDKLYEMKREVNSLMMSYYRTLNWFAATLFTQCDQTSFTDADGQSYDWTLCADGGAWASDSHTSKSGGCSTLDNKTTNTTLDGDYFETVLTNIQAIHDDNNQKGNYFGTTLIVPFNHRKTALELIGSEGKPDVTNNNYNIYNGHMKLIVWKWLDKQSGKTYYPWYVIDEKSLKDNLYWFDRIEPEISESRDFETMSLKIGLYTRFCPGIYDWRPLAANIPS